MLTTLYSFSSGLATLHLVALCLLWFIHACNLPPGFLAKDHAEHHVLRGCSRRVSALYTFFVCDASSTYQQWSRSEQRSMGRACTWLVVPRRPAGQYLSQYVCALPRLILPSCNPIESSSCVSGRLSLPSRTLFHCRTPSWVW